MLTNEDVVVFKTCSKKQVKNSHLEAIEDHVAARNRSVFRSCDQDENDWILKRLQSSCQLLERSMIDTKKQLFRFIQPLKNFSIEGTATASNAKQISLSG